MSQHGFRFYRFNDQQHLSHLPESVPAENRQSTELKSAEAIFLPSHERMNELNDKQRIKLAFLLHTVYGIKDIPYALLADIDSEKARKYLVDEGLMPLNPVLNNNKDLPDAASVKVELFEESDKQEILLPHAPHMSAAERKLFKKGLKSAREYFEFGSGGSTVWAVKEGLTVQGVESDPNWVGALKNELGGKCQVEVVDIGPTKQWGYPVSNQACAKFPEYSQAIHRHSRAFDFILVDGRFRVACTMAAIQHTLDHINEASDTRIFIHDFWNRSHYHVVLRFLEPVEKVETAGLFRIAKNIDRNEVASVWEEYAKQPL